MAEGALRVGVIGTGGMGGRHARNLAHRVSGAELVAVMDVDQARANALSNECGGAAVFDSGAALISDPRVEAVLIASPDPTHADLAVACIEAGKPVLCEKPLGVDIEDAKRVLDAEVAGGRKLVQVGLMRTFDPQHAALKRTIDAGEIGRPLLFRGIHTHWRVEEVRTAVNVIVNSAVHDIHSARWLMGDDVASVYTSHVVDVPEQPESTRLVLLQLTFRGGGLASIEVNLDSNYGYEVIVEVSGEKGALRTPSLESPILRKGGGASRAVEGRLAGTLRDGLPHRGRGLGAGRAGGWRDRSHGLGRLRGDARRGGGGTLARDRTRRSGPRRTAPRPVRRNGVGVSIPDNAL